MRAFHMYGQVANAQSGSHPFLRTTWNGACAYVSNLLRIRLIRILADVDFANEGLKVWVCDRQVERARQRLGSEGQRIGECAIDRIDTRLMNCAAGRIAR